MSSENNCEPAQEPKTDEKKNRKAAFFDPDEMVRLTMEKFRSNSVKTSSEKGQQIDASLKDDDDFGPPLPPKAINTDKKSQSDDSSDSDSSTTSEETDDDDEEDEDEDDELVIPDAECAVLRHSESRPIQSIAMDATGSTMLSACQDGSIAWWTFSSMDSALRPAKTFTPVEDHVVVAVHFSAMAERFLVVSGNAQALVYTKECRKLMECPKGDMYIRDPSQTVGHTGMLTDGRFHPTDPDLFITTSVDDTLREWSIKEGLKEPLHRAKPQIRVLRPRDERGQRVTPSVCTYSPDGSLFIAGTQKGSLHVWDRKSPRPLATRHDAHSDNSTITCLRFSFTGGRLATRSTDGYIKLWRVNRMSIDHVASTVDEMCDSMTCIYPRMDVQFSPNERLLVTGSEKDATLHFFHADSLSLHRSISLKGASPKLRDDDEKTKVTAAIQCFWHPKIHQLFVGLSNGDIMTMYDVDSGSVRGVTTCVTRAVSKRRLREENASVVQQKVITPYALPLFREERPRSTRVHNEINRRDAKKTKAPERPLEGVGMSGRVGATGSTLHQYLKQKIEVTPESEWNDDVRASILRHADDAKQNPIYIDRAYKDTQPTAVFAVVDPDADEQHPLGLEPKAKKFKP